MALKIVVLLKILQMVYSSSIPDWQCNNKGGISIQGQCFIFSEEGDTLSWEEAVKKCPQQYGPLASPADPSKLEEYAGENYDDSFWVGGYSPPNDESFTWIDGVPIPFNSTFPWGHWAPGEKLPREPYEEHCLEVNYFRGYTSKPCSEKQRYICSLDSCGVMGGMTLGHQCLKFRNDENLTWEQATHACTSATDGGELAIPAYPKLLINYVQEHFPDQENFWLGGFQTGFENEDSWYWLNGQTIQASKIPRLSSTKETQEVITQCLNVGWLSVLEEGPEEGYDPGNCDLPSGFICELDTSMKPSPAPVHFVISQISSGEYIGPDTVFPYIINGEYLTLHSTLDPNMYMTFDIVDGIWGYIRHVITGKILTPMADGTLASPMNPPDGTNVVLQSDHRPWALFALDQYQNRIIHRSGKFISSDGKYITITGDESNNYTMGFQFMNIAIPHKEVLPYGYPVISGDWELVFSAHNFEGSAATYSAKVTIGRSESRSSKLDFKFGFEVANDERGYIHSSSCSSWQWNSMCKGSSTSQGTDSTHSLSDEMEQASSETWDSEKTHDISFTVEAGKSVAVWQRKFIIEHKGHRAVHLSNMYRNTESPMTNPDNFGAPERPGFLYRPSNFFQPSSLE